MLQVGIWTRNTHTMYFKNNSTCTSDRKNTLPFPILPLV